MLFLEERFNIWNEQQTCWSSPRGNKFTRINAIGEILLLPLHWQGLGQAGSVLLPQFSDVLAVQPTFSCKADSPPPTPFYFNLQIPPSSELLNKYLAYLNLFCIFTANLKLAPSLGQDIEFLSPTRNVWAHVNSCQSLWNCVWSLLSDMKSMLEPRASTSVL